MFRVCTVYETSSPTCVRGAGTNAFGVALQEDAVAEKFESVENLAEGVAISLAGISTGARVPSNRAVRQ